MIDFNRVQNMQSVSQTDPAYQLKRNPKKEKSLPISNKLKQQKAMQDKGVNDDHDGRIDEFA